MGVFWFVGCRSVSLMWVKSGSLYEVCRFWIWEVLAMCIVCLNLWVLGMPFIWIRVVPHVSMYFLHFSARLEKFVMMCANKGVLFWLAILMSVMMSRVVM